MSALAVAIGLLLAVMAVDARAGNDRRLRRRTVVDELEEMSPSARRELMREMTRRGVEVDVRRVAGALPYVLDAAMMWTTKRTEVR